MRFAELLELEVEYVAVTRDTTEADLKQRREIVGANVVYVDQPPVQAAVHGRLLVIEGIEKAERNVLPTLNNLLENREMALDDGRFLCHPARYDKLAAQLESDPTVSSQEAAERLSQLVRVHPDFVCVALGLPVPRYPGYPLDPPLRSRFQARNIAPPGLHSQIDILTRMFGERVPTDSLQALSSLPATLRAVDAEAPKYARRIPTFPVTGLEHISAVLSNLGAVPVQSKPGADLIRRVFPYQLMCDKTQRATVETALSRFGLDGPPLLTRPAGYERESDPVFVADAAAGTARGTPFVMTGAHDATLTAMLQDYNVQRDLCVVGPKGCGKSALVRAFAQRVQQPMQVVHMFRDMTSRDLLQRRTTDSSGNTIWTTTPLVRAALNGEIAVLDGVDRVSSSTLAALRSLIEDRDVTLFDGTRLIRRDRFDAMREELGLSEEAMQHDLKIQPIHEDFTVVAVGLPPSSGPGSASGGAPAAVGPPWLSDETLPLFGFHHTPELSLEDSTRILRELFPNVEPKSLSFIIEFARSLSGSPSGGESGKLMADASSAASLNLSLRQLIRIVRRFDKYPGDLEETIRRTVMAQFLPTSIRHTFEQALHENIVSAGLTSGSAASGGEATAPLRVERDEVAKQLRIGDVEFPLHETRNPELVPHILFYDIPKHVQLLQDMLKDLVIGEKHMLLIGNQGVGKNKLADRLLELLGMEREYMQLHRDTTVQSLTVSPNFRNGRVVYEDSPLLRAVRHGHCLVIDEADKAPLEVVSILKGLFEDGEMWLANNTKISRSQGGGGPLHSHAGDEVELVPIHPDFRCIVLANRPGFPFLGNDFFREIGDSLSCHVITNPDRASEVALLKSYGPDVPDKVIGKLIDTFGSLRDLVAEGVFAYPYSTRELVAIVKHMQQFPDDGLLRSLENVLAFDVYDAQLVENLHSVFHEHGIPITLSAHSDHTHVGPPSIDLAAPEPLPPLELESTWQASGGRGGGRGGAPPGSRGMHTLSAAPTSGGAGSPVRVESEAMKMRTWIIDRGVKRRVDAWTHGRFERFNEQLAAWKVPMQRGSRAMSVVSLPADDSVHVLVNEPLSILSFHKSDSYRRYSILHLEDFLPFQNIDERSLHLCALPEEHKLVLHAPSHNCAIVVSPDKHEGAAANEHKARNVSVSVAPVALTTGAEMGSVASAFLDYMSPGFKVPPTWRSSPPHTTRRDREHLVHVDALNQHGQLLMFVRGKPAFTVLDFVRDQTLHGELPEDMGVLASIVPLSANKWLVEVADGRRYFLHDPLTRPRLVGVDVDGQSRVHVSAWSSSAARSPVLVSDPVEGGKAPLFSVTQGPLFDGDGGSGKVMVCNVETEEGTRRSPRAVIETNEQLVVPGTAEMDVVDLKTHTVRRVRMDRPARAAETSTSGKTTSQRVREVLARGTRMHDPDAGLEIVSSTKTSNGELVTLQGNGTLRLWQLDQAQLAEELTSWKQLFGTRPDLRELQDGHGRLRLEVESDASKDATEPKHGKVDENNDPHVGGNTWQGGTGGSNTAGMGGVGGPYRVDAGHDVHQLSEEQKARVSEEVKQAAREIARAELEKRLAEIDLTGAENAAYNRFYEAIAREVDQLRLVLESAEAKQREREWLRHQTQGELDEGKLVDGITGDRQVYRRRGYLPPQSGLPQRLPKRLHFCLDVSASMYRFNGYDQRLDRLLEAALLIMEAFEGFEHKFQYCLSGHSGDAPAIDFVRYGEPPKNLGERLKVLQRLHAHAQFCMSGDNTLAAARSGIQEVIKEEADEHMVFLVSDANLARYGYRPHMLTEAISGDDRVKAYVIFLASFQGSANKYIAQLPVNSGFNCEDVSSLPHVFRSIFSSNFGE